jgi:hypothetical protein
VSEFLEPGKFYLKACPWDWTFVFRYVQHVNNRQEIETSDCIYFQRTGKTFGKLTTEGLVLSGDSKSLIDGGARFIPAQGPTWEWKAETPWVKKKE